MATVIRTSLEVILPVIVQRLVDVTGFPSPERVYLTIEDPVGYHNQADQYIAVQVLTENPNMMLVDTGGRFDARTKRQINVHLRTRLNLDEVGHDTAWLVNASLGHLRVEHQINDALQGYEPVDASNNWLVSEPMDPGSITAPRKAKEEIPGWGESVLSFLIPYINNFDQSYQ